MPYIGKQPTKVPLTSADIADGTITNDDLAGSITSAKITSLDATKLTGTVAPARMGSGTASSTTVLYGDNTYKAEPVTDTTSIKNDISLLALQNAINGNLSAYGLKNSWIEQFENSTYIENLTNAQRYPTEYMGSGSSSLGTPAYYYGSWSAGYTVDRNTWITPTTDMTIDDGTVSNILDGSMANTSAGAFQWSGSLVGKYLRFQFTDNNSTGSTKKLITEARFWTYADDNHGTWKWQGSDNASDWTDIGSSFALDGHDGGAGPDGLLTSMSGNSTAYTYYQILGVSGVVQTGSTKWVSLMEFEAADETVSFSATGSFESTDVVPQDTTNKSSVGMVMLYKDEDGTNTLNTDIIAKVRANTGQAYQTLVLAGAGTYSDGMKIAIAPAIAVTAGQALSYQISFANQSDGSKEARIYGVAMTY